MTRGWLWLVILITLLWMPMVAAADAPEWGAVPTWEETAEGSEAEEAPVVETKAPFSASQPREARVSTPVMVGLQAGAWFVGTMGYAVGALMVFYVSLVFGLVLGAAPVYGTMVLLAVAYPMFSAAAVEGVGSVLRGGQLLWAGAIGELLGNCGGGGGGVEGAVVDVVERWNRAGPCGRRERPHRGVSPGAASGVAAPGVGRGRGAGDELADGLGDAVVGGGGVAVAAGVLSLTRGRRAWRRRSWRGPGGRSRPRGSGRRGRGRGLWRAGRSWWRGGQSRRW